MTRHPLAQHRQLVAADARDALKGFSHACSLISFMPSSASASTLMRESFTFIHSSWM